MNYSKWDFVVNILDLDMNYANANVDFGTKSDTLLVNLIQSETFQYWILKVIVQISIEFQNRMRIYVVNTFDLDTNYEENWNRLGMPRAESVFINCIKNWNRLGMQGESKILKEKKWRENT